MSNTKVNLFYPSKPHAKQQEILDELDSGTRWVLLRAGRKFRKTSLMISWLIEQAIKTGLSCPYIAPSKVQAKNIVWDDHISRILYHFKEIGFPYKVNETELTLEVPSLAKPDTFGRVQLFGVENAESLRGISNWGAVGMDEYDDWSQDIWPLIIRPNLAPHKAPALIGGTPKGYGNIWKTEQTGIFKCFHFKTSDNPDLDPIELADIENEYKSMGEGYYRQEILAEYERPQGTVYEEWSESNYKEFGYDPYLPLHISMDFGVNDPTAIIWIQPNGGEFRVIDYYEASDANVAHFVQVIRSKPYQKPDLIVGDAAGKARDISSNTSPIEEYGKHNLHIRTKDGLLIPNQIRITHKYIPTLMVNSSKAGRLRECLLNYRYPEKRSTLLNQSNEIPLHNEFSHGCRALEYYFANIDGGGLMKNNSGIRATNMKMKDKWSMGGA